MGYGRGFFKNFYPPAVYMPVNGTLYFIVDPGSVPGLDYTGRRITMNVMDPDQTPGGCDVGTVTVDRQGNELKPLTYDWNSAGNATFQMIECKYNYQNNQVFIIKVKEHGIRGAWLSVNWN